jgi:hypothetical protein
VRVKEPKRKRRGAADRERIIVAINRVVERESSELDPS